MCRSLWCHSRWGFRPDHSLQNSISGSPTSQYPHFHVPLSVIFTTASDKNSSQYMVLGLTTVRSVQISVNPKGWDVAINICILIECYHLMIIDKIFIFGAGKLDLFYYLFFFIAQFEFEISISYTNAITAEHLTLCCITFPFSYMQ